MAQASTMEYVVVEGWEQLPTGYAHRDVAGVAVDGEDRVYLICRGDHPIIVYDQQGNFLRSWGEGAFTARTHGISVGPNGTIFCTDDGNHTVRQFTPEGKLLLTLGVMHTPSDTGYDGKDLMTITRGAGPFNHPTNIAVGPQGDLYVSDGYGNCRVHQFSSRGQLKRSWGSPGRGPGEFYLPHGIAVAADGRVFVCDRESDRIQIFSPDGEYLSEWTDIQRPTHLVFDAQGRSYVSELWWHPGDTSQSLGPITQARQGRVSIFAPDGHLLARWGTPDAPAALPRRTGSPWTPRAPSTCARSPGPSRSAAAAPLRTATRSRSSPSSPECPRQRWHGRECVPPGASWLRPLPFTFPLSLCLSLT